MKTMLKIKEVPAHQQLIKYGEEVINYESDDADF